MNSEDKISKMKKAQNMDDSFGNRIKNARQRKGLSLEEAAVLLSIKQKELIKYESNLSLPRMRNLITLAKIYGTTTDYLLGINK